MKLMHPLFSKPIEFRENHIQVLTVENPVMFRKMVGEIVSQSEGEEGEFVLSEQGECLDLAVSLHPIGDFFHLNQLERKIQTKLFHELLRTVSEEMPEEALKLSEQVRRFLGQLSIHADFPIAFDESENIGALLKAMDVHLDFKGLSMPEALCEHISLYHHLIKNSCIVLIQVKDFLGAEELAQFYTMAKCQKWRLLLIESHLHAVRFPEETHRVYDCDLCELNLEE